MRKLETELMEQWLRNFNAACDIEVPDATQEERDYLMEVFFEPEVPDTAELEFYLTDLRECDE